jgi:apolipoprotein N-acyltransferase
MRHFFRTYGPAILSGVLLAFSFPGFHFFALAWVALVPLLRATAGASPKPAFWRFLLAGYVFHAILLQWLLTHFYWAGGVAFLGHQLLTLYLALFWGWTGALWAWLRPRLPRVPPSLLLALMWAGMEFVQATLFSGFGWSSLGYSQGKDLAFLQLASLGGTALLSFVLVLVNALLAEAKNWKRGAVAVAVVALAHLSGYALLGTPDYASRPLKVGVLQANFAQEIKWDPEFSVDMLLRASEKSRALASYHPVDLFVWPESLITQPLHPEILATLQSLTRDTGAALFSGATRDTDDGAGEYNSSVLIDDRGEVQAYYDKIHLAPFGEYVPFGSYLPFLTQVVPVSDLAFGEDPMVLPVDGRRMGPLICFEVLFSGMAERLRADGADFLVVITNLGWFGQSNALPQELEIARMRSVELRMPLVHSANTGISGVFDPWGRFEPLRGRVDESGHYWEAEAPGIERAMVMRRGVQAFDVAAAADRPLAMGPRLFGPLCLAGTAFATIAAAALSRRRGAVKAAGIRPAK